MYWCHCNSGVPTGSMGTIPLLKVGIEVTGSSVEVLERLGHSLVGNGTVTGSAGVTGSCVRVLGSAGCRGQGRSHWECGSNAGITGNSTGVTGSSTGPVLV